MAGQDHREEVSQHKHMPEEAVITPGRREIACIGVLLDASTRHSTSRPDVACYLLLLRFCRVWSAPTCSNIPELMRSVKMDGNFDRYM